MTSRIEACPNIALEAMAAGARIISTTAPPMPEFFADIAAYYVPSDCHHLAALLQSDVRPGQDAHCLRQSAVIRSRRYSWERTAAETVAALQRARNLR
jgi:glycosyltransferase involved in cell wall biosynthesis